MAGGWRTLPDRLGAEERELVAGLRAMKDGSGLTLAELAAKTHYSKSSWHRWLNGERVVTEPALTAICVLAGVPEEEGAALEALRVAVADAGTPEAAGEAGAVGAPEAAEAAGSPEAAGVPEGEPPPVEQSAARLPRIRWWVAATVTAGAATVATVLTLGGGRPSDDSGLAAAAPATATGQVSGSCEAAGCVGKDPQTSGCGADATTIATANVRQMTIYVRYSRRCRAAWAKLTDAAVGYNATVTNAGGQSQTALVHWGYDAYSPMVDASQNDSRVQVCGRQPDNSRNCTPVIMDPASAPVVPVPTPTATATSTGSESPAPTWSAGPTDPAPQQ